MIYLMFLTSLLLTKAAFICLKKNSTTVEDYYNLKELFSILIYTTI